MMTELCQYLRNWFDNYQPKFYGTFIISNGAVTSEKHGDMDIKDGQFYRIVGSSLNDGVWQQNDGVSHSKTATGVSVLRDETFTGAVWLMAIPPAVISLCEEISEWQDMYGKIGGSAMSPYSSESFDGYSYSKASGGASSNGTQINGWMNMFGSRLSRWRKI